MNHYYYTKSEMHKNFIEETVIRAVTNKVYVETTRKPYSVIGYTCFRVGYKPIDNYDLRFYINDEEFIVHAQFYDNIPLVMTIISADNTFKTLKFNYYNYSYAFVLIDNLYYYFRYDNESLKYC